MNGIIFDNIHNNKNIEVSVICITYNHLPYIRNTLEHLINQCTSFKFEIIIHDDNSNDGTQEIIKEYFNKYPNLIRVIIENENQYSKGRDFMKSIIFPMVNGKYVCFCEGDDYWPALDKLQQQYDFLESNLQYVAIGGQTETVSDDGVSLANPYPEEKYANKELTANEFLTKKDANIGTNTIMFRNKLLTDINYLKAIEESTRIGDLLLMMNIFDNGKLYVMREIYQEHIKQTRQNSSNFNNIYTFEQRNIYMIKAVNAIRHFKTNFDMKPFLRKYVTLYFSYCLKRFKFKEFVEYRKMIYPKYRENLVICIIKSIPSILQDSPN